MASGDDVTRVIFYDSNSEQNFESLKTVIIGKDSNSFSTVSNVNTSKLLDFSSQSGTEIQGRDAALARLGFQVSPRRQLTERFYGINRPASAQK